MFSTAALRRAAAGGFGAFTVGAFTSQRDYASCHCQVPCGIFDDPVRASLLKEDAATIRKAMVQVRIWLAY